MKTFKIKKKQNKKYPYKIKHTNGARVLVPSQYDFNNSKFIRSHGCIIAALYMGLRYAGKKKSMIQCLKYLQNKYSKGNHLNYNLELVGKAINKLCKGNPAKYYKKITKKEMWRSLKCGKMVLFTEREPIHTAVLLFDGSKVIRFSDGKYKNVTVAHEINKRCGDDWYKGCVVVERRK